MFFLFPVLSLIETDLGENILLISQHFLSYFFGGRFFPITEIQCNTYYENKNDENTEIEYENVNLCSVFVAFIQSMIQEILRHRFNQFGGFHV
jgi:hypothetical protein